MGWLSLLRSPWLRVALLALACGVLWARGSHYRNNRDQWRAAYEAQLEATKTAAAAAEAKAIAARQETETRYAQIALEADRQSEVIDRMRAAGRAYADAHRLRAAPPRITCGTTTSPGESDPAPLDNGPGGDAIFLGRNDFEILVANSARLEQVKRWGDSLIAEGLAIPQPEFGQ